MKISILLIGVLIILATLVAWGDHEWLRYTVCREHCRRQRYADSELVESAVCQNPVMRHEYGEHETVNCNLAERRLYLTIDQCARNKWRREGDWMRIWNILTASYLRIVCLIIPVVCVFLYFLISKVVSSVFRERRETRVEQKYLEIMDRYARPQITNNPFQLRDKKRRRRKPAIPYDERNWLA